MTPERWRRIKEVFESALAIPPGARDAYVASETPGDGELQREVQQMLRHASGTGMLDRPAWDGLQVGRELNAGDRLGPYEILEEAGSGGMGRVYKARDIRLGRTVAIKVLNAEFSHRLGNEGRAISALNHPNVCALYDIGDQGGTAYLIMEYVPGESLAECLARGPLPLDSVLRYGAEIASALAAAHAQGIVHRDLKPANIMITEAGVKVLDFGVARIAHEDDGSSGTLVGTVAYMSPSQLNGMPAEARSDVFALGLVLCEMLTGSRVARTPARMPPNLPPGLTRLIERCLQPDPGVREQYMEDVRDALEGLRAQQIRPAGARWTRPAGIAAVLAIATVLALFAWKSAASRHWLTPMPSSARLENPDRQWDKAATGPYPVEPASMGVEPAAKVPRVPIEPPSLVTLASYPGTKRDPSVSPDGSKVAFSWHPPGQRGYAIWTRTIQGDNPPANLTDGMFEDWGPAWSPDAGKIAFRRRGGLSGIYWVAASGGTAHMVAPISRPNQETLPQISWSRDGKWIAAPDRGATGGTELYLYSTDSSEKRALTSSSGGTDHAPAFSPAGRSLAYASCPNSIQTCDVYVLDLGRNLVPKQQRRITNQGVYIRGVAWLPDGRSLVYAAGEAASRDTFLWRVSVNPPGIPERIDMAGSQARHPSIARTGGMLAYTRMSNWSLMLIKDFR